MKDEKKLTITLWSAVAMVLVMAIILVATMVDAVKHTSEATKYDLDCVTELNENPLAECKE